MSDVPWSLKYFIGKRYGKLKVIDVIRKTGKRPQFHVRCLCGNEFNIRTDRLKSGEVEMCYTCSYNFYKKQRGIDG